MSKTTFKTDNFSIQNLINDIKNRKLALPKIQRGYAWKPSKIPDLFDSLYRKFPINTLILWKVSKKIIDANVTRGYTKNVEYLLLDGQ